MLIRRAPSLAPRLSAECRYATVFDRDADRIGFALAERGGGVPSARLAVAPEDATSAREAAAASKAAAAEEAAAAVIARRGRPLGGRSGAAEGGTAGEGAAEGGAVEGGAAAGVPPLRGWRSTQRSRRWRRSIRRAKQEAWLLPTTDLMATEAAGLAELEQP